MPLKVPELPWGPKKLRKWFKEEFIPWIISGRPIRSLTCEIDERPAGTLILPIQRTGGAAGGGGSSWHPFRVTATVDELGAPQLVVELDSWLARGVSANAYEANAKFTITGLGAPFAFAPASGGKFYVWLEATLDAAGDITGVTVEHGDEPWDESATLETDPTGTGDPAKYPYPVAFFPGTSGDPGYLAKVYVMLAYTEAEGVSNEGYTNRATLSITEGETTTVCQIAQCVTTHLILCEHCLEGRTVLLFFPFHAPCLHDPPA